MKRAAIAIGVDKPKGLPPLHAAASGARQFLKWAEKQPDIDSELDTELITDEDSLKPVTFSQIYDAVARRSDGSYSQLLIYFAGHGILVDANTELWLLSNSTKNKNEAVNVRGSIESAADAGIPHVVFISDACRSWPDRGNTRFGSTRGSVLFPSNDVRDRQASVDEFYATRKWDVAVEAKLEDAARAYEGLFTTCLMNGLQKDAATLAERGNPLSPEALAISSRRLKDYLEVELPELASRVDIRLSQTPDIRVLSNFPPLYFCLVPRLPVAPDSPTLPLRPLGVTDQPEPGPSSPIWMPHPSPPPTRGPLSPTRIPKESVHDLRRGTKTSPSRIPSNPLLSNLAHSLGLGRFFHIQPEAPKLSAAERMYTNTLSSEIKSLLKVKEPATTRSAKGFGVRLRGSTIARAWCTAGPCKIFKQAIYVSTGPETKGGSLLIEFAGGNGTCLGVIPGFVATVILAKGEIVAVNYTPAKGNSRYERYLVEQAEVERSRALAAVASRNGYFRVEHSEVGSFSGFVRQFKVFDPALALYVCYGYSQSGARKECASVYQFMEQDRMPVLFDVALLARKLQGLSGVSPCCPMLSQGWSLLTPFTDSLPAAVREAANYLAPSLWTLIRPKGIGPLTKAITKGELR